MRVHFSGWTFDSLARKLHRGNDAAHLSPKAFRLLEVLIEQRPTAVSKQTLMDTVWPNTFVEESNLHTVAKEVRIALRDDARQPKIVRTVFSHGYAFVADATEEKPPAAKLDSVAVEILPIADPFDRTFVAARLPSLLLQDGVGKLGCGFADLVEFFFRLIFDLQIIIDRHHVFRRDRAGFFEKARIDIETPGRLTERPGNDLLSLAAQQPIDENFGAVRVRRRFDYRQVAAAACGKSSLFEYRKRLNRQTSFKKWRIGIVGVADHDGDASFGQTFRKQPLVAAEI